MEYQVPFFERMETPNEIEGQFSDADETEPSKTIKIQDLKIESQKDSSSEDSEFFEDSDYEASDEFDDFYYENEKNYHASQGSNPNRQNSANASQKVTKFQPTEKVSMKFVDKINIDKYEGPAKAMNKVLEQNRRDENNRFRVKDKSDRATMEQVMDPRTRMILFKLLNRNFISEINGCISTGKEANVYHCTTSNEPDRAIKIYKTSILVFKDRDKYVSGEFRFRGGYGRKNPRKMVRTWAEKEMRNLTRLWNCGIPCPKPILLR